MKSTQSLLWRFAIANLLVMIAGAATGAGIVAMARGEEPALSLWTAQPTADAGYRRAAR